MPWFIDVSSAEDEFIGEVEGLPDRMVGLLLPVIIDRRLEKLIKGQWKDDGKILKEIFRDGGPLGSFSTRIDIGFAIKLYSETIYRDLKNMGKIRNDFAHKLEATDFDFQSIRARTEQLKLPEIYPITVLEEDFNQESFDLILAQTEWRTFAEHMATCDRSRNLDLPRQRFIRSAQILLIILSCLENHYHTVSKAEPLF